MRSRLVIFLSCFFLAVAAEGDGAGFSYRYGDFLELLNRARIPPLTPDQNFATTRADGLAAGEVSLGLGGDIYGHQITSYAGTHSRAVDKDALGGITAAYGLGGRATLGLMLPFLVRDRNFEKSGVLDLMLFGRYRFLGEREKGLRLGGELLVSLPTAGGEVNNLYSLETAVARLRLLASGDSGSWGYGANAGYQSYGRSATGKDSDLLYGAYLTRALGSRWTGVLEYAGATHFHPGVGRFPDDALTLGVKYAGASGPALALAAGTGVVRKEEKWRLTGRMIWSWGGGGILPAKPRPSMVRTMPPAVPAAPSAAVAATYSPSGVPVFHGQPPIPRPPGVLRIEVANRSGIEGRGRRIADSLKEQGFPVSYVDDLTLYVRDTSYVYYAPGFAQKAGEIAGKLKKKGGEIEISPFPLSEIEILIVVGADLSD